MATEILMPKLGLTMTEGTIDEWKKNVGDAVQKGEIIFSVETDKLTNDVEAELDGVLLRIDVPAGETVPCKTVIGWIGAAGEAIPEASMEKLWDKFYKVDKARTRAYGGSGIGLSIVKAAMDNLGGTCAARNTEGGVEFIADLPGCAADA